MSEKHIFCLGSRPKLEDEEKGITQKEWDLKNINPYDSLQVHSLLKQHTKTKNKPNLRNVNPYDLLSVHSHIKETEKRKNG